MWAARRVRAPERLWRWSRTCDLRPIRYLIAVLLAVAGLLASVLRPALAQEEPTIRSILVQGNQRIEAGTIATYLTIHEGDTILIPRASTAPSRICSRRVCSPM